MRACLSGSPSMPLEVVVTMGLPAARASAILIRMPDQAWTGTTTTQGVL